MSLSVVVPAYNEQEVLPADPGAHEEADTATFAFELQAEDPAATDAMLQGLCIAVSFDGENVLMIEGLPSTRCALFLRRHRAAEEI